MRNNEINTEELVEGLLKKEREAYDTLYDNYSSILFGLALKITHSKDLAEDVLQETLVKVFNKIDKYDKSRGKLSTWVINICRNTAIDKIRYGKENRKIQLDDSHVNIATSGNPETIRNDTELWETLNKLEKDHKIILELSYYYGFTHKEIAEKLDLPLGTVKSRIRIALRELRKIYP